MSVSIKPSLEELLARIRAKIISRGSTGIQGLGRLFRIADDNGDRKIDLKNEFPKLMGDIGVLLNKAEIAELGVLLDRNGDGSIDFDEFVFYLGPPMNAARQGAIDDVFNQLDADKSGTFDLNDIRIRNPNLTQSDQQNIAQNLFRSFDKNGDNSITKEEFNLYYREVSPNFNTDQQFIETIYRSWNLKQP
ncbi:EF hand family protein [Trichomonas vaginalis G3]|uniref:EF hand family protein n=1 Tax=Trichomonas vaginalis (strain ATCC PRA-98 / G3) TaxID=412133 RepID=A2FG26_TRIV3|nr:protein serine/threonine kinase protein [Trichomonas vaginalis G3]EAX96145.1 EF hand family protein [Trichomonas vaginalis G3]KAI5507456.1 protein serine/threonine kinase protein [Trichomonas vaginalis G3]|eukprot:XP_001309075.1 EF hand family protein [Trichomonas vaginalis G3]